MSFEIPCNAMPTRFSTLSPAWRPEAARLFQHCRITNMSSIPTPAKRIIEIELEEARR